MGLGKTLQALTLLWTMLNSGHPLLGKTPLARRAVICCPTSLVGNWEAEARKFLRGRLRVLALCECSRDEAADSLRNFLSPRGEQVLIVSYETFRIHAPKFDKPGACDLLICDEVIKKREIFEFESFSEDFFFFLSKPKTHFFSSSSPFSLPFPSLFPLLFFLSFKNKN